jgi:hypothetical protein
MKALVLLASILMLTAASTLAAEGPVRHVVSFKFKKSAAPEAVKKVEDAFAALKRQIPLIQQLEWGTNVSPEGLDKGFTHCWIVSFRNEKDRDAYLVHPEHKAFVGLLKDVLEEAFVFDFIPKE